MEFADPVEFAEVLFDLAGESIAEFDVFTGVLVAFFELLAGNLPLSTQSGLLSELEPLFLQVAFDPLAANPFSSSNGYSPGKPLQSGSSTQFKFDDDTVWRYSSQFLSKFSIIEMYSLSPKLSGSSG